MDDGLFDLTTPTEQAASQPAPMTARQREMIRELFATLGIADASSQFEMVAELTGVQIKSVSQLEVGHANTLIQMLTSRAANAQRKNTGNSWDDRDEDTWIDRL